MLKGIAALIGVFCLVAACSSVRKFDESTGTFGKDKEYVASWNVGAYVDGIVESLEKHGKVKLETVKEENPWVEIILGAMMAVGGLFIVSGIVWTVYNLIYLAGKYVKSGILAIASGMGIFGASYFLMEYAWILMIVLGVVAIGFIVWLVWYLKDNRSVLDTAVKSVDVAIKGKDDDETKDKLRIVQGKHQSLFKAIKNEVLKQ